MKFFKYAIFVFIIALSSSILAQEEELEDDFLEDYLGVQEDIACEDLPESFNTYQQDIQANDLSNQKALRSTVRFLRQASEEELLNKQELLNMIEELELVNSLSMDNTMILSTTGNNIAYFLSDCIQPNQTNN